MTTSDITVEQLNERERLKLLPTTIVLVILLIVGLVGNLLVICIYKRSFKRSSARVYILCLATADFVVCIVGLPYHVLDLTFLLTYTHSNVCKGFSYLIGACTLSSVFILLVVGMDRYLKVCRPLKKQIADFGDMKACLIAVAAACVMSIPHGILYGESSVQTKYENITGVECFTDDNFLNSDFAVGYLSFNLLIFIFSIVFLIIVYVLICRKIRQQDMLSGEITVDKVKKCCCCFTVGQQGENSDEEESDDDTENKEDELLNKKSEKTKVKLPKDTMIRHRKPGANVNEKHSRKITLMMLTITVVFIISYLPFILISILDSVIEEFWTDLEAVVSIFYDFCLRFYIINNVANPIIYCFWDQKFRQELEKLLKKLCRKSKIPKGTTGTPPTCTFSKHTEEVIVHS